MKKCNPGLENTHFELSQAYQIAATVVKFHGDTYLPIFKRLHEEFQKSEDNILLKSIALQIAHK